MRIDGHWVRLGRALVVVGGIWVGLTVHAAPDLTPGQAPAKDWPMWGANAQRTASSRAELPETLHLRWMRKLGSPASAWPESQKKIRFDVSYEPVVAGKRLFVGSMVADRLTAYDTGTGDELWRYYADGPIRFAPVAWKDNVYFVSDDGCLYCLDAATGRRKWLVRGGPDGRMALGNERLISIWPARGAPVLWEDPDSGKGTIYFAASIWPFMGIFIHAIDAGSGATVWSNSGSGSTYLPQQHSNSPAFAGVAPQGYLAATTDTLLVSGGRTVPAAYDRKTGRFLYFNMSSRTLDKSAGGYDVCVVGDHFFNHGCLYRLSNGEPLLKVSMQVIGAAALDSTKEELRIHTLIPEREEEMVTDRHGNPEKRIRHSLPRRTAMAMSAPVTRFFCEAGGRLYGCGSDGLIGAVNVSGVGRPGVSWTAKVNGDAAAMIPADDKLFVVTVDGTIYCFGEKAASRPALPNPTDPPSANDIPKMPSGGYALMWGLGDQSFERLTVLARDYHVIVVDPDAEKVASLRRKLDAAGLYGRQVHALVGKPSELRFPPYLASRIEFGNLAAAGLDKGVDFVKSVFHCLRPYGGAAACMGSAAERTAFQQAVEAAHLAGFKLAPAAGGDGLELRRDGPLPDSAAWTHQYADVANTVVSRDRLVKPPLGLLWFGGPSNDDILPRHGHGPSPQVAGGRMFIEGPDVLRAIDVYTGRLLWQREFKGLGRFFDNIVHQPGAGEIGGNYVSLADAVYVVHERHCLRLDPATGATLGEFALPKTPEHDQPHWGYLGVYEDLLIGTSTPVAISGAKEGEKAAPKSKVDDEDKIDDKNAGEESSVERNTPYASSSQHLVVMDRHSGRVLWTRQARQTFRHNAIVAGGGKIFCMDAFSPMSMEILKRRGEAPADEPPVLLALDARTGVVSWQAVENVEGTWLGYSAEHDLLLASGSPAKDRAKDEFGGSMAAYRGRDGQRLWQEKFKYKGTPILHSTTIYTDGAAVDLLTGKPIRREDPFTGQPMDWSFLRNHGCATPIAGQHMLLFRSGAAGFYDLQADAGTANWGGFKSGCTPNLIPADGVLVAPDYTRTCTCSYQNQSSLALVSMPDVEVWTFQSFDQLDGRVQRVGINFGAPGNWRAPDGTLWLEHPAVGGKSPKLSVEVEGQAVYFRRHAMEIQGPAGQVTASGVEDARSIRIGLNGDAERSYTIRLYFAETEDGVKPGQRVFDVKLQGQTVLKDFDVVKEAGGARTGVVKEFKHIRAGAALTVELAPVIQQNTLSKPPILSGVELFDEEFHSQKQVINIPISPQTMNTLDPFPPTPREIPVTRRLRCVETRPVKTDVKSFVASLKEGGANVVTISPTSGKVLANFPSKLAVHHPDMDPDWIPNVIQALREAQISIIFWMPFNVQDLKRVEDLAPAKQFPQWTMKFIADPDRPAHQQIGMCVQSSPYREHHARFLAECAAFDIDAMWFDGFYLGGIPHPTAPGCVCEFCAKRFKQATGLEMPKQVDWTDPVFKRWLRWRNQDLISTMVYFRDAIQKVKPGLPVSANTNRWPFGNKDWDTAIPLWRITEFGVSEHAHVGKPELEWLMLGFKSRLAHDTNPGHADIWRPAWPIFRSDGTTADIARHEHDMLTFMLSALSHGIVPWHGGQSSPIESEVRVHHAIARRERFLSGDEINHVAVWVSQDTHDFYGHIPGGTNLVDYRDTVLGNWLVLSRAHVPFQFVFDNMIADGQLKDYKVLLAPNVAAMSAAAAAKVREWTKDGGRLIFTAETSAYDEWGNKLPQARLGQGDGLHLPRDPGLAYVRDRDLQAVDRLLDAIRRTPPPLEVKAPPYVLANTFHSPDSRQLWVHLLNVSDYMPNDDTGFRGLASKRRSAGDGATDAHVEFTDKPVTRSHKIARNIVIRSRAWPVKSASLGVAGTSLPLAADGSLTIPELDVHDVVVLTLK